MAINIKEIFQNDTDSDKVDKTNYNFDQLAANGGGPTGAKGQKGEIGAIGTTGVKGEKGDLGEKGDVGPAGQDVSAWARIDHNSGTTTSIIKPRLDGTDDTEPTSIWLGDTTFNEGVDDGENSSNAWINVSIPDSSTYYDNFINYISENTSLSSSSRIGLTMIEGNSGAEHNYVLKHIGAPSASVNYKITIKNKIELNGPSGIDILSSNSGYINLDSVDGNITIGPLTGVNSAGNFTVNYNTNVINGNLNVVGASGGFFKPPVGDVSGRPSSPTVGMIRYNTEINSEAQSGTAGSLEIYHNHGSTNSYWKPLVGVVDADGDTFISPDFNLNTGLENVITIGIGYNDGTSYVTDIVAEIGNDSTDGADNLERTFVYNKAIDAQQDILINRNSTSGENYGLRVKQNASPAGTDQVTAQNNGAPRENRTIFDYFYRESALQYSVSTIAGTPAFDGLLAPSIPISSYRYTDGAIVSLGTDTGTQQTPLKKVATIIDHNTTRMSYVKVGHMVTVWGRLDYFPYAVDIDNLPQNQNPTVVNFNGALNDGSGGASTTVARAAFTIGTPGDFPYTSALSKERVVFPISVNLKAQDNSAGTSVRYFGVIEPGSNVFTIMEVDDQTGFISDNDFESVDPHYAKFLDVDDLVVSTASPGEVITLEYSFSMPTDINSFDLTSDSISAYNEGAGISAEPDYGGGGGGLDLGGGGPGDGFLPA
jgi:hypothetical protein